MASVQIVTDSAAELSPELAALPEVTVVPWTIHLDGKTMVDGPELRTPEFHQEISKASTMLVAVPPTLEQFAEAFDRCARITTQIVVILSSDRITRAVQRAQQARTEFVGRCQVRIIDSLFLSCVQGALVEEAVRVAQIESDGEEIVRYINGLISRSYWGFYVQDPDTLIRQRLVEDTPDVVGTPSGYKPLLLIEDGAISPLPRSRKRGEPLDRMVEFVGEFGRLQRLWTVSTGLHPDIATLHEQLVEELPKQSFEDHVYGPVVTSFFGPSLLGVAAIEAI